MMNATHRRRPLCTATRCCRSGEISQRPLARVVAAAVVTPRVTPSRKRFDKATVAHPGGLGSMPSQG
ncbi:unnamed protein product [Lampetra fluviatilis]